LHPAEPLTLPSLPKTAVIFVPGCAVTRVPVESAYDCSVQFARVILMPADALIPGTFIKMIRRTRSPTRASAK
jgi:hypothetical protein